MVFELRNANTWILKRFFSSFEEEKRGKKEREKRERRGFYLKQLKYKMIRNNFFLGAVATLVGF